MEIYNQPALFPAGGKPGCFLMRDRKECIQWEGMCGKKLGGGELIKIYYVRKKNSIFSIKGKERGCLDM